MSETLQRDDDRKIEKDRERERESGWNKKEGRVVATIERLQGEEERKGEGRINKQEERGGKI